MKPCRHESIYELIEGELSPGEAAGVRQHAKKCIECGRLLDQLRPAAELFKQMPAMDLEAYDALVLRQRALSRFGETAEAALHTADAASQAHLQERDFERVRNLRPAPRSRTPLALFSGMSAALVALGFLCGRLIHINGSAEPSRVTWSMLERDSRINAGPAPVTSINKTANSTRVSVQPGTTSDQEKLIVIDRVLPSGTRVIWNYSNTEGE